MKIFQYIILIGLIITPLTAVIVVLKVLQNDKWQKNQKILSKIRDSNFLFIDNIKHQTTNYYYLKAYVGYQHSGNMFINDSEIIILHNKKPNLFNIKSTLPLILSKSEMKDRFQINVCNWKAILITFISKERGLVFFQTELLIEPKDMYDFERIKNALINW